MPVKGENAKGKAKHQAQNGTGNTDGQQSFFRANRVCTTCLARDMSHKNKATKKIPVLSYFTGGGLLDLGFTKYNFDIVWRNENNGAFVRGFEHAMAALTGNEHTVNNTSSIVNLKPKQVLKEAFGDAGAPETFGIIGGPPCPDFSNGGKNRGEHGDNGKLSNDYVKNILALRPAFFLFENVKGLFKTEKHRQFFDKLTTKLERSYLIDHTILNALDFGVPQNRERVFLIGFSYEWLNERLDVDALALADTWFPWPVNEEYEGARNKYTWPARAPFGSQPEKPEDIPDQLMVGTHICNPNEDLSQMPNGNDQFNPKSQKFQVIEEGDDTRKSFKRLHRWRYSPAAAYGNNEVHLHPTEARRLSLREVLRVQTVPDKYELPADLTLSQKFKMIGNGVPVDLAEAVAGAMARVVNNKWAGANRSCCQPHSKKRKSSAK
jgi:DNA (cytosine-5)-methyltransferase 1